MGLFVGMERGRRTTLQPNSPPVTSADQEGVSVMAMAFNISKGIAAGKQTRLGKVFGDGWTCAQWS